MIRRGISLLEILISLVILGVVVGVAMTELQYQNGNWQSESEQAAAAMMAKGTLDALTYAAGSTGGDLPEFSAGLKVWGPGQEKVTFVLNERGWVDTAFAAAYHPGKALLEIAVDSAAGFQDKGYVLLGIKAPVGKGSHGADLSRTFVLGISARVARTGGCGRDSLVLDATPFLDSGWNQSTDIKVLAYQPVYGYDSLTYWRSQDTLYLRQDQGSAMAYAVGVDSFRLQYHHPVDGWEDSLSPTSPANAVDKLRIRLVTRTLTVDHKLLQQDPASRGYRLCALETEVSMRNSNLVNR